MRVIILITILFTSNTLFAQAKYDTISFHNISLNNREIFTYFKFLKDKIDDKKNKAKVYPSEGIKIPFTKLKSGNIIYNVISDNLGYYYTEKKPEYIYVTFIKPNQNLILKIKNNFTLNNDFDVHLFYEKWICKQKVQYKLSYIFVNII